MAELDGLSFQLSDHQSVVNLQVSVQPEVFNRTLAWSGYPSPPKPSDFALGDESHAMINKGERGCVVWVWKQGSQVAKVMQSNGFICPKLQHVSAAGNFVQKKTSNCCVMVDGKWVQSVIYLSDSKVKCCSDMKSDYSCRVLDNSHPNWTQIGVFRGDGWVKTLVTPAASLSGSLLAPGLNILQEDFNFNIEMIDIPFLWRDTFHLKDNVFGANTHRLLMNHKKVMVYVHADQVGVLGSNGVICSRIYHFGVQNISTCTFVVPFDGKWNAAPAYATKKSDATCCKKLMYQYKVRCRLLCFHV